MADRHPDPRKYFTPRILPWLLATAMFVVYGLTLNHWLSAYNLAQVTRVSNQWLPELRNPLLYLVTYPFRWLPIAQVPIALNLFSAICAALSLGLLARSVVILPQDRTEAQRKREHSEFSFLTVRSAWLPPLLAVAVCGLQMTFWEHATNYTGEMFDLLLFAFLIRSLLEYRLDERESRLVLASFVCGAGMTENWAMVGFFPLFVAAIVSIRGWDFFNLVFLRRMFLAGVAGLMLYLLLPVIAVLSIDAPVTFWQAVKFNLVLPGDILRNLFLLILHPRDGAEQLALGLAYLFPLLMISIRWRPAFGDKSNMGAGLTSFIFHLVHAALMLLLVWVAFDPPFGPRHSGGGLPMLTFYYLGALSIGYFTGYFLLVFGEKEVVKRPKKRSALDSADPIVFGVVWIVAGIIIIGLAWRNPPQIRAENAGFLSRYATRACAELPAKGGYLLSDDVQSLTLVQFALAQEGRGRNFVPLDTHSLIYPAYHRYLHKQYPSMWPEIVSATQTNVLSPFGLISVMALLARTNDLYYLHPSYGYYFEQFYQEPHGVVYQLKPLPPDTLVPPRADKNLIEENEAFWAAAGEDLKSIEKSVAPPDPTAPQTTGQKLLGFFHLLPESNETAGAAGIYYSRALNCWGVQLQRAGELEKAAGRFAEATNLYPDNAVASINHDFNETLAAGKPITVDPAQATLDRFGKFATWNDLLTFNGPFDEPSFCFVIARTLENANGFFRQAVSRLNRVRELAPTYLPARYELARAYLSETVRLPDRALDALQDPLDHPEKYALTETNQVELITLAATAYFQKNDNERAARLLLDEITRDPENEMLANISAQIFITRGLYNEALSIVDRKLKTAPNDWVWLYNRGYTCMRLNRYEEAIAAFDRVLAVQTNNADARFCRAISNLQLGNLDAAKADYAKLQQTLPTSAPIAYGLGEIAYRRHDTNEAVRNYELYLANAATNTDEAKTVAQRLRELKK